MKADPLERELGYRFARKDLLLQAFTHRSHSSSHNERLEFVGDGVLNCVIAALLFRSFPDLREGELSRLRASLVREETLAELARSLGLGQYLRLGGGELKSGGVHRPSMLADALEALIGAIFLDAGFDTAAQVIEKLYAPRLSGVDLQAAGRDPKTALQEFLQARRLGLPSYTLRATHGEAHAQEFEVECVIAELKISSFGSGHSRRAAEQAAAKLALEQAQAGAR